MSPARYPLRHVAVKALDTTNVVAGLESGGFQRDSPDGPVQLSQAPISTVTLPTTIEVPTYIPDISSQWYVFDYHTTRKPQRTTFTSLLSYPGLFRTSRYLRRPHPCR